MNFEIPKQPCIYALYSSSNLEEIRYIGFSSCPEKRLKAHIQESKQMSCHRHYWIQKEISEGNIIILKILKEVCIDNWQEEEIKAIKYYKSIGCNLTNNAEGGYGGNMTPETKEKIRQKLLGNSWNKGRKPCEENLRLLDIARRRPKSKEHIEKILETKKKNNSYRKPSYSEETVIKIFELFNLNTKISDICKEVNLKNNIVANILYMENTAKLTKEKYNLTRTR